MQSHSASTWYQLQILSQLAYRTRWRELPFFQGRTFAVFLTEMPVPPFGAVEYIGDFTTNAHGTGHVRVDAIIDEAFAFNNITGVRTDLNHVVFWFADPADDEDCVPGSAPGHFDGDGESGVAAMSSKNFLPGAPLP